LLSKAREAEEKMDTGKLPTHGLEPPPEQQAIRAKCFHPSGEFVEFPKEDVDKSIPERFEKIVQMYPEQVAVKTTQHEFTYNMLNQAANGVAQAVLSYFGRSQEPVALLFENEARLIATVLGVLKAGKFYVPLDASYPHARNRSILESLQARLIVTNSQNLSLAKDLARDGCRVYDIDESDFSASAEPPGLTISSDGLANVLFTSGSTGQPKGVMQTHRNILHEIMNYTNGIHICAADRLALLSSPSFADAVRTIYGALLNGAGLYPLALKHVGLSHLADWLIQQRITIYRSVPSVSRHFIGTLTGKEQFLDLRLIYSAGDSVSWADIKSYKRHFSPSCIFINGLGSTESLTYRWCFIDKETPIVGSSVPVGYTLRDQDVLLLDENGDKIGFNEIGQIAVKSRYLSPGYWNRPDLTATAFLPCAQGLEERTYLTGDMGRMLPDGCLTHLGRKDFQVKIRGQRIEVAEIEMALLDLNTIKEAVVVAREDQSGERRLVAYLVPKDQPRPAVATLRRALAEKLPDFMIPSSYMWVDALPLNANKKVDRRALPDPGNSRPELDTLFAAPRTFIEEAIARIWAEVLSLDQVGIHDKFFDLGGHSLGASRVISRVIQTFQLELPLKALFDSPTVAEMAKVIDATQGRTTSKEEIERMLSVVEVMSEEEAARCIADAAARSTTPALKV
jgi:amino acid adenylation domain-containing protein